MKPNGLVHPAADRFPMLPADELRSLAEDIAINGLHHAIVLLPDGTLLDGRNRLAACDLAGVMPTFSTYHGDAPYAFVVSENIRRRHLEHGQAAFFALRFVDDLAVEAEERRRRTEGRPTKEKLSAPVHSVSEGETVEQRPKPGAAKKRNQAPRATDKAAALVKGVSGRAVAQAKRIAEQAPDLVAKVESGEMTLKRAERIIRDRQAEQRRIAEEQARRDAAEVDYLVDIRHGDFRQVLTDLTDVDAIITDPPYPAEFLPLLGDLASWADKVLKPDGVLAVLIGQTYLPEVYRFLDGARPYRWTAAYMTPGAGYVSYQRKVQSNWKPVIVYGGGPRFADVFTSSGDSVGGSYHEWGQDYRAFVQLVERLTKPGDVVVDPFMGAGTTLLAANAVDRHAIGCDINAEHVATAKSRLMS